MNCRFCDGTCHKRGVRDGVQQYYCKSCDKYQRRKYKYASYEVSDGTIVACVKEGVGIRSASRLLGISTTTLIRRIRLIAKSIKRPPISFHKSYEVDELYTFIENKRKGIWIVLAFEKEAKRIVDFYIGPRTKRSLRMVVNTLHASNPQLPQVF